MLGTGLVAHSMEAFQASGWFGYTGQPTSAQPWCNRQLWDWSHCCSTDINQNKFFGLVGALFGYEVCPLIGILMSAFLLQSSCRKDALLGKALRASGFIVSATSGGFAMPCSSGSRMRG